MTSKGNETLFLVDGSGYTFRAYHSLPPLTRSDGTPVNAVLGFVIMLMKLIDDLADNEHLAVIFDTARKTFRNDIYQAYKANRTEPPDDLIPQFQLIREAVEAFNIPAVSKQGYEADDLIATYVRLGKLSGIRTVIVSSDKDLMQLIGPGTSMFDPSKNIEIGRAEVVKKFGVGPEKVVDVQSLAGDSVDNVPGVPGIGVKTAAILINEYEDLDTLLDRAHEIKQPKRRESLIEHADLARVSRKLVRLDENVPDIEALESLLGHRTDDATLLKFLEAQEFKNVISRVRSRSGIEAADTAAVEEVGSEINTEVGTLASIKAVQAWVKDVVQTGEISMAVQTDTPHYINEEVVGFAMCSDRQRAVYVPVGQGDCTAENLFRTLEPLFRDPSVAKIGCDIKRDLVSLGKHGTDVGPFDDVQLMAFSLQGVTHTGTLEEIAQRWLSLTLPRFQDVVGSGKSTVPFSQIPTETAASYLCGRVVAALRAYWILKTELVRCRVATVYERVEKPTIAVLSTMERTGIRVDGQALEMIGQELAGEMARYETECYELAGQKFNLGSPQQVGQVLFEELGLKGGKKGKSGSYSTDAAVLDKLAGQGHLIAESLLSWRQLSKLKSTYTDALPEHIDPKTGRVHSRFAMAAASTGRLSSVDPNLMNIPIRTEAGRKIRKAFVPAPGSVFVSMDYSQIELRILSHIADIEPMLEAFCNDEDIHAKTAAETFGVDLESVTSEQRRKAKAINFGIIYGQSAFGLARQLGIPQREAKAYIENYFERYPGIREYMEITKQYCQANGAVRTLFGRKCLIPGINDRNHSRRGFAERAAINAPIQGTGADLLKRAISRVPEALSRAGIAEEARLLLTVHDELLFEVREEVADKLVALVRPLMQDAGTPAVTFRIPLVVDAGSGKSWAEAH